MFVESDSQRPILLGRKGAQLKKLSTDSRLAIEQFLGACNTHVVPPYAFLRLAISVV